jgi:hypothetical protein
MTGTKQTAHDAAYAGLKKDEFIDAARVVGHKLTLNKLSHKIHVVAFSDEEGLRFQSTFLGSRAFAGCLPSTGFASPSLLSTDAACFTR